MIINRSTKYLLLFLIFLLIVLTACSNNYKSKEYLDKTERFYDIYFKVVESIDLKDHKKSIEKLQSEENSNYINELGNLLVSIKDVVPTDKKIIYEDNNKRYNNLLILKQSYQNYDSLTSEEKRKISNIFISIGLDKENWKDSNIVWN